MNDADFRESMQEASELAARLAKAVSDVLNRESTPIPRGIMALIYLAAAANVDSQMLSQPDRTLTDEDDELFANMTGAIHLCVRAILTKKRTK